MRRVLGKIYLIKRNNINFYLIIYIIIVLVVQMAEEYYNCKDYGKVLT